MALKSQEVGVGTSSWPGIQPGPDFYAEGRLLSPSPEMGQRPASDGGWSSQCRGWGGPQEGRVRPVCVRLSVSVLPPGKGRGCTVPYISVKISMNKLTFLKISAL